MMHPKAWKILVSRELQYNLRDAKFEKLMFLRRRAKMFKNSCSVRSKNKKKKKKIFKYQQVELFKLSSSLKNYNTHILYLPMINMPIDDE